MTLTAYRRKRDFGKTPEPTGKLTLQRNNLRYIIQKHDASRLHYDLRLELDGVLKSWAVPKGPSLDPVVKSLAVEVEDHPLEYGSFEGTIPQGQYGGGTVMLWDEGTWIPDGDARKGLKSGRLTFELLGHKLTGRWRLVRLASHDGDRQVHWLLMKSRDHAARPGTQRKLLETKARSVKSRRNLNEIAAGVAVTVRKPDRVKRSSSTRRKKSPTARSIPNATGSIGKRRARPATSIDSNSLSGARLAVMPAWIGPQLATLADAPPTGSGWVHEVKFDGYRLICIRRDEKVSLWTRNRNDWTDQFRQIAEALKKLRVKNAILDGEIIALNAQGMSDFQALQRRLQNGDTIPMAYAAFDLIYCNGFDLRNTPLMERKRLLKSLIGANSSNPFIQYSEHVSGDGAKAVQAACKLGLEGLIFKRAESLYESRRTANWLKVKCTTRREFVVGGFTEPQRSRQGFGALLLGEFDDGGVLKYRGRVGTGFSEVVLKDMRKRLSAIEQSKSPFERPLTGADASGVHWVKPTLLAEVTYRAITSDGLMRQPSFEGLRMDKPARQVTKEREIHPQKKHRARTANFAASSSSVKPSRVKAAHRKSKASARAVSATSAAIVLTHPDKIVFPDTKVSKAALAAYYDRIADRMLPHMVDRPLMLARCPNGAGGECFYQKHFAPTRDAPIDDVRIREKRGVRSYPIVDSRQGLAWLVQMNTLEIHGWGSRRPEIEKPDMLVFDLDPGDGVAWKAVIEAALVIRGALKSVKLVSFVKTSGGKGLHVVAPLTPGAGWDTVKGFGQHVAEALAQGDPKRFVSKMTKSIRKGRIFIDYLRNGRGASCVLPYSTRARPGAPLSMPVNWAKLSRISSAAEYTVERVMKSRRRMQDPWSDYFSIQQALPATS